MQHEPVAGFINEWGSAMPLKEFTKVAVVSEMGEKGLKAIEVAGEEICLAKVGDEFFAINNICTHFYTWLSEGGFAGDGYDVQCPLHDSRFSLRTGKPTGPPANKPVKVYAVKVEGDDILIGPAEDA